MKCAVCVLDKVSRPARAETTWQGTALCATHLEAWVAVDPLGTFRPNGCSRACSEMHTFEPPCQLSPALIDGLEDGNGA